MGNYAVVAGGDKGLAIYQLQQSIYPPLKPPVIAGGMMTMTWPYLDGARLQMATNLAQPFWQDVPASEGTNTLSLPMTEVAAFFRLVMGPKPHRWFRLDSAWHVHDGQPAERSGSVLTGKVRRRR